MGGGGSEVWSRTNTTYQENARFAWINGTTNWGNCPQVICVVRLTVFRKLPGGKAFWLQTLPTDNCDNAIKLNTRMYKSVDNANDSCSNTQKIQLHCQRWRDWSMVRINGIDILVSWDFRLILCPSFRPQQSFTNRHWRTRCRVHVLKVRRCLSKP